MELLEVVILTIIIVGIFLCLCGMAVHPVIAFVVALLFGGALMSKNIANKELSAQATEQIVIKKE